jgi:peptide/nickel transport system ATP-binding protein
MNPCRRSTHDLAVVEQIADRVVVMEQGRVVEQGETMALLSAPAHAYTRRLVEASPSLSLIGHTGG